MAQSNPYYTKGTDGKDVLINKLGITTAKELEVAEYEITAEKLADLKARKEVGKFDYQHLKSNHEYIFKEVYDWAGKERTIPTEKNRMPFQWVDQIKKEADKLFTRLNNDNNLKGQDKPEFVKSAAKYYGELNFIHPFPEGNGRSQRSLFDQLGKNAGFKFDWHKEDKNELIEACIHDYARDSSKLEELFTKIVSPVNTQTIDKQTPAATEIPDDKTVYSDYKAAKATIAEAADSQLAKLKEPLEREQRQLGNKIRTIEKAVAVTEKLKPGMFSKASHEEQKQKLSSQLSTAISDLHEFKRELPKKEAALRREAKESAQKKYPAEAEKIKRWEILDKQKRDDRKNQGRDPPKRSR